MKILARQDEHPEFYTGWPDDSLASLPPCRCGSKAIATRQGNPRHPLWVVACSSPHCENSVDGETPPEAGLLWEQAVCPAHSWMPIKSVLGLQWWRCIHCGKAMEEKP